MAYIKSMFWLVGFTGLGFALLKITTPNVSQNQSFSSELEETQKRRAAFLKVLKGAADEKEPIYRQTKEEIERTLRNKN